MRSFQELLFGESLAEKCIKCSRKSCNIFWKSLLAESFPVNVLELQLAFLFAVFPDNLESNSLEVFFKLAVLKHFTKLPGNHLLWGVLLVKINKSIHSCGGFLENFSQFFQSSFLTPPGDCFRRTRQPSQIISEAAARG